MTDEERERLTEVYPLLRWFDTTHLKDPVLVKVVNRFRSLALGVARDCERSPEVTVCMRKLLEAKDAAVRSYIGSGTEE